MSVSLRATPNWCRCDRDARTCTPLVQLASCTTKFHLMDTGVLAGVMTHVAECQSQFLRDLSNSLIVSIEPFINLARHILESSDEANPTECLT